MSKQLVVPFSIGVVIIAIAIGAVLYMQRGAHIELRGSILKVRLQAMDENSCVAVMDFRFANPADYPFVIRRVDVTVEERDGKIYESTPIAETDAKKLFEYYPLLGQKYNTTLLMHDKIPPRTSEDRMIAVRFELPVQQLERRKAIIIRIEDVDGPVSEVVEGAK
jgi:hypothetical protein